MNGIFITGTGTGVGKSWIGHHLTAQLYRQGIRVIPQKPVESGCHVEHGKFIAEDARGYYQACKGSIAETQITPFRYTQICSPARAAQLAQQPLSLDQILRHIKKNQHKDTFFIVEGAGGLLSPLTSEAFNLDLIKALGLDVLLVAKDQLGCINDILLSLNLLQQHGVTCRCIVLNEIEPNPLKNDTDNLQELKAYTKLPVVSNPWDNTSVVNDIIPLLPL